jgi:hypothetical protein
VLYGKYALLDWLTAYKVRPAPVDPPGKFETDTGNFEDTCGVLGALEYIEWVGETFGAEHAEQLDEENIYVWDGNYYALEVTKRLGLEESGGMVRVGPVPQNRRTTTRWRRSGGLGRPWGG